MESLLATSPEDEALRSSIDVDVIRPAAHVGAVPRCSDQDKRVERLEGRVSAPKIERMLDPHLHSLAA